MSNEIKKFAGLETLQAFLDSCKTIFANITHKHTMSDITDYTVDSELSSTSTNPVQNAVLTAELDAIKENKSDWNENDPSSTKYIENRTHWVEQAKDILLEEQSMTGEKHESIGGYNSYIEGLDSYIYSGEQYIITVDGISYNCESYLTMYGEIAIGDSRLGYYVDEGTPNAEHPEDVPFHIQTYYYSEETWELINEWWEWEISFATAGTHTVKIERINPYQSTYHTLDENFIPDTISRTAHTHNYYGVCSTDADVSRKTVNIDGFKLVEGAMVIIKFTNANSAYHPTLNVSGTGAYPMYLYGTTKFSTILEYDRDRNWVAGAVQVFVYDGNGWIRDYWNYKDYTNGYFGHAYVTCSTEASTVAKTATSPYEYRRYSGGIVSVKFENSVPDNATLSINNEPAEPLYYRGVAITNNIIKAGDVATFIYYSDYHLLSIDRWQKDIEEKADKSYVDENFALKSDLDNVNVDLSEYETKEDAQLKYDSIVNAKADWNQNDEIAIDYVKNRTHWVGVGTEVILEEQEVVLDETSYSDISGLESTNLIYGSSYIVTFDGVKYSCDAWAIAGDVSLGDSRICDAEGNPDLYASDVPFVIQASFYDVNDFAWYIQCKPELANTSHTLKIEIPTGEATYHTLDERFIPDSIARTADIASTYALKSDIENIDLSAYETKTDAQSKYDTITEAKADWNQNDESAIDYVKNRTHYIEEELNVIIPEQVISNNSDIDITSVGITYYGDNGVKVVIVDGIEYRSPMWQNVNGEFCWGDSRLSMNDGDIDLNHENAPYYIYHWMDTPIDSFEEIDLLSFVFADGQSHTVEVKEPTGNTTYHTLDENFIPSTIARQEYVNSTFALKSDIENIDLSAYETKEDAQVKYDTITEAKADWNQNDETALDYVKNRTHWVEEGSELICQEQTIDGGTWCTLAGMEEVSLQSNLIVTFDGVKYKCESWLNNDNMICFGNGAMAGGSYSNHEENSPFLITWWLDDGGGLGFVEETNMWDVITSGDSTHTIKIEIPLDELTYHTLDERFIPDTIARKSDMDNHARIHYVTCNTAMGLMNKYVYIKDFQLVVGTVLVVKFIEGNMSDNFQLEVGMTGSKPVYYYGTTPYRWSFPANTVKMFVYDGSGWMVDYDRADSIKAYADSTFAKKSDVQDVDLSNYYTKPEIDNLELITVDDIDVICGGSIQYAEEVLF